MAYDAGQRVGGYVLVERLGAGGQGSVWKARDAIDPSAYRALKLIDTHKAGSAEVERMRREARVLVRLSHPSLVQCHGAVEDSDRGVLGLVLECVEGASIAGSRGDPRFTLAHRFAALLHVARALAHVHAAELVHRDLKPQNVLLERDFWAHPEDPSTVKLVDFGISVATGNHDRLTRTDRVVGTPPYMAPEAIDATTWMVPPDRPVSDVFALGVVAWELLVGGHPTGLTPDSSLSDYARAYREVLERRYPWPPHLKLTGVWGEVVTRCLALDARNRPASGTVVLDALGESVAAPEVRKKAPPPPRQRRPRPEPPRARPRERASPPPAAQPLHRAVPSFADDLPAQLKGALSTLSKVTAITISASSLLVAALLITGVFAAVVLFGIAWAYGASASGSATASPASRPGPQLQRYGSPQIGRAQPGRAPR
jgi:serine/threonine-protein kinase